MKTNTKAFSAGKDDLAQINRYTRRDFTADEVYTFSVILCDNEVDRDFERFTDDALLKLARLFVGKTGIFDHNPSGKNQAARIYHTEVFSEEGRKNSLGGSYRCVKAKAYMVRGEKNADLIAEIDGGIKKEVSVGCSVGAVRCSVCGADVRGDGCAHLKGRIYEGGLCHHLLEQPTDAYEWSFVAVPAQAGAGVVKSYRPEKEEIFLRDFDALLKSFAGGGETVLSGAEARLLAERVEALRKEAALGEAYREELRGEVRRLAFLAEEELDAGILEAVTQKLDIDELKAFQKAYEARIDRAGFAGQLTERPASRETRAFGDFKI